MANKEEKYRLALVQISRALDRSCPSEGVDIKRLDMAYRAGFHDGAVAAGNIAQKALTETGTKP